jgi:septal ring factor EnvC (AmiA/AmiB activator)
MDMYDVVAAGAGALASILMFFIHRQNTRIDRLDEHISDVRIEIARQQQENKELQTHIHRIDKNLDELFKKMEEILFAVRKNGKN